MRALLGECWSCLEPGAVWYEEHGYFLCPKCATNVSMWIESKAHLLDLIEPAVKAWYAHWLARGVSKRDLTGTFEDLEEPLARIVGDF